MGSAALIAFAVQVLSLEQAVRTAEERAPALHQAVANTAAARARADEARAPLLPQATGSATYQRKTNNFASGSIAIPTGGTLSPTHSSFDTINFFNFGVNLSLLLTDFGVTPTRWRAAQVTADAQRVNERGTLLQVVLGVRTAYFSARAQRELVQVARETLANRERHLAQAEGFVAVGTRPEIDLAQARTDRANAKFQLINAENNYAIAKAQLNQAMGVEGPTDYDVADEVIAPLADEDRPIEPLLADAIAHRPDLASLEKQILAQELTVRSLQSGYAPALSASTALTDAGADITNMAWNWNFALSLNWNLFQGLLTHSQVNEAEANVAALRAQLDAGRQQVRLNVDQTRLAVRAAKEGLIAAAEALLSARERLNLAEGRYQAGVGNVIELGDAQVALTNASAQRVQAEYNVATARAQLLAALGRL